MGASGRRFESSCSEGRNKMEDKIIIVKPIDKEVLEELMKWSEGECVSILDQKATGLGVVMTMEENDMT